MNVFTSLPKPLKRIQWKYRMLLWQFHRRFSKSMTLKTQQGIFNIPFDEHDAVSRHLYSRREFELEWIVDSLAFLRSKQLCPPKGQGTVLDIGANNGVISIGMLATGEFERAIAVEPAPRNFSQLQGNVAANDFEERFTCLNFAASDGRSELEFELSENNHGDHRVRSALPASESRELFNESNRRVIKVPSDTIDSLLANLGDELSEQVSLVWIDVQGYEGFAFRGAADLLSKGVPVVSEIWPYGIERAGMSLDTYCEIASGIWSTYWTERRGTLVQHPIAELPTYAAKLARGVKHENVIFTK
ncbi:MAG: FkbM family methyltransferase [Planctomycetes bacterium]|nr:FkbM family methyltransferase [Planctomycetota bacterium]